MGILINLGSQFGTDGTNIERMIRGIMEGEYKANIEDVVSYAKQWQPSLDNGYSFEEEMEARCNYLRGSMWGDMQDILEERFPQTHTAIESQQVNLQLYRRLVESKARAFYGQGTRFYLEGEDGEELKAEDKSQVNFQRMLERGRFLSGLKDADRYTQALSRCVTKLWWDARARCVQFTVWPQHLVFFAPDPVSYWSMDDCPAVLFELPDKNGIHSVGKRYEVWSKAMVDGTWQTKHFRTGKEEFKTKNQQGDDVVDFRWYEEKINETDTFPFLDEETGEPVYPFWLWTSDTQLMLYNAGCEDSLTVPRQINAAMTDMAHSIHYNANPIFYWKRIHQDSASAPPAVTVVGPGQAVGGGDFEPAFAHPAYDAQMYQEVWKGLTDLSIQMEIGTSSGVMQEAGGAESGISVAIKRQPLYEYRQDIIEIYRPHVIETLKRAVMVHNAYCEPSERITGTPCWEPGDVVDVQDKDAEAQLWILKIEKNIATPVDWLMHETGMDREQAEARIQENVDENKRLRESSSLMPMIPGAPQFGGKPEDEDSQHAGIGVPEDDVERKPKVKKDDEEDEDEEPKE